MDLLLGIVLLRVTSEGGAELLTQKQGVREGSIHTVSQDIEGLKYLVP